jgi:hypothetical protein
MKNQKDREDFIQLRAQGISYDKISEKIGVSKPTLIKWNQECSSEIANLAYFNVEGVLEQYKILKRSRIEALASALNKALEELSRRDFKSLPTKDLISSILVMENKLKSELANIRFHSGEMKNTVDIDVDSLIQEKTIPISY